MKTVAFWLTATSLLALNGCAMSRQMVLPDGSRGEAIRCGGALQDMTACYQKAGDDCPFGYSVLASSEENNPSVVANQYGLFAGNAAHRSLIVKCK